MDWFKLNFNGLNVLQLYQIMALRSEVFIVEQNCVYQDADEKDINGFHVFGVSKNEVLAYSRILPPGVSYEQPSIGRVVTSGKIRGNGFGKILMQHSINFCHELFPQMDIVISAQQYLERFYIDLGFVKISEMYLEDNIPHIKMKLKF